MSGKGSSYRTRIGVVFSAVPPETPTWPMIGYDYESRARELFSALSNALPHVEFRYRVVYYVSEWLRQALPSGVKTHSEEDVRSIVFKEMGDVDGYVVWFLGLWSRGVADIVAETGKPVVLVDDLYAGSGELLLSYARLDKRGYPVIAVASSNFDDVVKAVKLLDVVAKFRNSRILVVTDAKSHWATGGMSVEEFAERVRKRYGLDVIFVESQELDSFYRSVSEDEAKLVMEKWIRNAMRIMEPSKDEILKSAKLYIAMRRLLEKYSADVITIDCLTLFYLGRLEAYPCLGYVELNDSGEYLGICEADVDSAATALLIKYLTGRPGFVSDPVVDLGKGEVIYAHCVAPTKMFGTSGFSSPYIIRSHAEDRRGASVQVLLPTGHRVTTVKLNLLKEAIAIHGGEAIENIDEEKACRTKLGVRANVEKLLEKWNRDFDFGWHRVTVYGELRKEFKQLAKLLKLHVVEEDI